MWNSERWGRAFALKYGVTISIILITVIYDGCINSIIPCFFLLDCPCSQLHQPIWICGRYECRKWVKVKLQIGHFYYCIIWNPQNQKTEATICKGVSQSNTIRDSCMNIFRKEISKIKLCNHCKHSYTFILFNDLLFVYATTRRGQTERGEHQLWGEKERKEEKEEI